MVIPKTAVKRLHMRVFLTYSLRQFVFDESNEFVYFDLCMNFQTI